MDEDEIAAAVAPYDPSPALLSAIIKLCDEARKQGYYEGFPTPEAADAARERKT